MAGWSKPSSNVVKVNCKGMFDRALMKASVGCVMRNNQGNWIRGASSMIGLVVPVGAQLWSIFYGLKLAWEKGDVRSVVVECDCEEAVGQVNNPDPEFWHADLVEWIKNLKNKAWDSCVIHHVPSSANQAAAALANAELNGPGGLTEHTVAPAFMASILAADRA